MALLTAHPAPPGPPEYPLHHHHHSSWLSLLPVTDHHQHHHHRSATTTGSHATFPFHSTYTHHDRSLLASSRLPVPSYSLPSSCCSIEALRDGLRPLYYSKPRSRRRSASQGNDSDPATCSSSSSGGTARQRKKSRTGGGDHHTQDGQGDSYPDACPSIEISTAKSSQLMDIVSLHRSTLPLNFPPTFFLPVLLNDEFIILTALLRPSLPTSSSSISRPRKSIHGSGLPTVHLPRPYSANESMVGCICAHLDRTARSAQILTLCVDPKYRRRGLALRLLTELAERLASSTTSIRSEQAAPPIRVSLHVQTSNTAAISLYKNVGFVASKHKKIGHYRGTRYGGADAWEMTKEL